MSERWQRMGPAAFAIAFASIPLFPSFITLTSVQFPGVSVVPFPLALVVLALMLLLAIWAIVELLVTPFVRVPVVIPLIAWGAASALAAIFGFNPRDGGVFICIFALSVVWYVTLMREYEKPGNARAIWWAYVLSGIVSCVLAIGMIVTRTPAAQYTIAHGRAVGTFVLPGELAGYLTFLVPVTYGIARTARTRALRIASWIAVGLGLVTMFLTFSRTGWVGLAAAIGFYVALRIGGRRRRLVAFGGIVLAALVLVLALFNEHHNPSENYTRISIWQAAMGVIDRFPLTGVGPFGFSRIYPFVRLPDGDATAFHAHSMYLTFLVETGFIGFCAFAWTLAVWAAELVRRVRHAAPASRALALAITAGLVGTLVQGLIDTVSVVIFGLLLPMLALALQAARSGTVDA